MRPLTPVGDRLVNLIEENAHELTTHLLQKLKSHSATATYHDYDENELYERAFTVYSHLGKWISYETTKEEIAELYMDLGAKRRKEGFFLSEVIQALILTRRQLWYKVSSEGFLDTILDMYQALELNNRVIQFFDRAIYYAALGYESKI
jgi:hypothetical protein